MTESRQFLRGLELFNSRKFFEAHEVWEELWLAAGEPQKMFLQGLIQLAAAFHHHSRGNPRGMKSLLAAALAKLRRFPDGYGGIALAALRTAAERWAEAAGDGRDRGARKPPRIRSLSQSSARKKPGRRKDSNRK